MTKDEALKLALEALENNKQMHYYCEDTWYSCPQHEEGCANDSVGDECNCGADKANAEIDKVITAIKKALAQTQEPVAWPCLIAEADFSENTVILAMQCTDYKVSAGNHWLSNTPPQRTWVGLTDEEVDECYYWKDRQWTTDELVRHVEAKLKEKNT